MNSKANSIQVGGDHYNKEGEQHWDRIWRLYGRGYFVGCATKYAERYHLKNGKQDLEKAVHFLQKLIELEYPEQKQVPVTVPVVSVFTNPGSAASPVRHIPGVTLEEAYEGEPGPGYVNQDR